MKCTPQELTSLPHSIAQVPRRRVDSSAQTCGGPRLQGVGASALRFCHRTQGKESIVRYTRRGPSRTGGRFATLRERLTRKARTCIGGLLVLVQCLAFGPPACRWLISCNTAPSWANTSRNEMTHAKETRRIVKVSRGKTRTESAPACARCQHLHSSRKHSALMLDHVAAARVTSTVT